MLNQIKAMKKRRTNVDVDVDVDVDIVLHEKVLLHKTGRLVPILWNYDEGSFYSHFFKTIPTIDYIQGHEIDKTKTCRIEKDDNVSKSQKYVSNFFIGKKDLYDAHLQEKEVIFTHRISILFNTMARPEYNTKKYLDHLYKKVFENEKWGKRSIQLVSDTNSLNNLSSKSFKLYKNNTREIELPYIRKIYDSSKKNIEYMLPTEYDIYTIEGYKNLELIVIKSVGQDIDSRKPHLYVDYYSIGVKRWAALEISNVEKIDLLTCIDDSQKLEEITLLPICNKTDIKTMQDDVLDKFLLYQEDVYQTVHSMKHNNVAFFGIPSGEAAARPVKNPKIPRMTRKVLRKWSIWKIYSMIPKLLNNFNNGKVTYRPDLGFQAEDVAFAEDVARQGLDVLKSFCFKASYTRPGIFCEANYNSKDTAQKRSIKPYLNLMDDHYFIKDKEMGKTQRDIYACGAQTLIKPPEFTLITKLTRLPAFKLQENKKWFKLLFPAEPQQISSKKYLMHMYKVLDRCINLNQDTPYAIRWVLFYFVYDLKEKLEDRMVNASVIKELIRLIENYTLYLAPGFNLRNFDFISEIREIIYKNKKNIDWKNTQTKYDLTHAYKELKKWESKKESYDRDIQIKLLQQSIDNKNKEYDDYAKLCNRHRNKLFGKPQGPDEFSDIKSLLDEEEKISKTRPAISAENKHKFDKKQKSEDVNITESKNIHDSSKKESTLVSFIKKIVEKDKYTKICVYPNRTDKPISMSNGMMVLFPKNQGFMLRGDEKEIITGQGGFNSLCFYPDDGEQYLTIENMKQIYKK